MEEPNNRMHIDNVVASQPELGPSPPDGRYGWCVLVSAMIAQVSIPSIIFSYGILILYLNMQETYENNSEFLLWDQNIAIVPVLIVVCSLLTSPWSKILINLSNRPRVVSISGVFLLTAGIMLTSLGMDNRDDIIFYNIFAGILAGFGTSLTTQQSEILLKHYFSNKLHIVRTIYRVSILLGNIFITLIMGAIFVHFATSIGLLIYAAFVWQNCLVFLVYSRPTYITVPLQKNYKILNEAAEDDDEEIYSSQTIPQINNRKETKVEVDIHTSINDDEHDEEVIQTFNAENTKRQVIEPSAASTSRLEHTNNLNPFSYHSSFMYDNSDTLYKETTIINENVPQENLFTFDAPSSNVNSNKRTMDVIKNMLLMKSVLKDVRFYIYTYLHLCLSFSILILSVAYPSYVYEQLDSAEMTAMVGFIMIMYIGTMILVSVSAFTPNTFNKKVVMAVFNILAFIGFIIISETGTKTWLMIGGVVGSYGVYAIYVTLMQVSEEMKIDKGKTVVMMASNCVVGMTILLIMLVNNFTYATYFKIASILHAVAVIPLVIIRKY